MKIIRTLIFVGVIGYIAYSYFGGAERDASGQIVSEGTLDAFSIRVGDCTNDQEDGSEISSVIAIPCSEPHDNEFYHSFQISHPEFPGEDIVFEEGYEGCYNQFEAFVGIDYESSVLDIYTLYPTKESWDQQNDREILCALYHIDLEKLEGSAKGLAI